MHRICLPCICRSAALIVTLVVIGCGTSLPGRSRAPASAPGPEPAAAPADRQGALPPPTSERALRDASSRDRQRWSDLTKEGRLQLQLERYDLAEANFLQALEISENFRPSDVRRRVSLSNLDRLAHVYQQQEQTVAFVAVAQRISNSSTGFNAGDYPGLSDLLYDLGITYLATDQLGAARRELDHALDVRAQKQGRNAASLQQIHAALAQIHLMQGETALAARHAERQMEIAESAGITDDGELISALLQLGRVRDEQRRFEEAELLYDRALAAQQGRAPGSLDIAMIQNAKATLYWHAGRLEEASAAIDAALAIADDHGAQGIFRANLIDTQASIEAARGQTERARKHFETAIALAEDGSPRQRAALLESYERFLRESGQSTQAEEITEERDALETKRSETREAIEQEFQGREKSSSGAEASADDQGSPVDAQWDD